MSYIILLLNVLIFLIIGNSSKLNSSKIKISLFIWSSLALLSYYYLFSIFDLPNPVFNFHFIDYEIPLYLSPIIIFSLIYQSKIKQYPKFLRTLLILLVAYLSLFFYNEKIIIMFSNFGFVDSSQAILFSSSLILLTTFSLFIPFSINAENKINNFKYLGIINFATYKENKKQIIRSILLFFLTIIISNIIYKQTSIHINLILPFKSFLMASILYTFYYAIVTHFVCFALTTQLLKIYLEGEDFFWGIVVSNAIVYASIHYMGHTIDQLGFEFLVGCIFAYLYLKTKSLSYGIILILFIKIFTV